MKTILLLVSGFFLISQNSFGKEVEVNTLVSSTIVRNFELDSIALKNTANSKMSLEESGRVWLNLTNAGGAFKQLLVAYVPGATNGWEKRYDSPTIDSNPYVDFYSVNLGKNLTIQGRGLPFVITDEVPLGYKTNIAGTFEISIDEVDGFFFNQDIFLKDLTTGVIHNLKNSSYSFTTLQGRFNDRFILLYVNATPEEPIASVEPTTPEITDPIVLIPEPPVADPTEPVATVPEVPAPIVTEPEPTEPVVTVPEVPAPIVTEPEPTEPVVTVPEVPAPIVTEPAPTAPVVSIPEVPAPTEPVVTVPEVPAPIVTEPEPTEPVVTIPEVPAPIVTEPEPTEPVVTVPEVPAPIVTEPEPTEPVVTIPEVPVPIVSAPEVSESISSNAKLFGGKGKSVLVSVNNDQVIINAAEDSINEVAIYNMGQKQLFERKNINAIEFVIPNLGVAKQVLIIRTQLNNGKSISSKIIL